jgi:hypothetical protein
VPGVRGQRRELRRQFSSCGCAHVVCYRPAVSRCELLLVEEVQRRVVGGEVQVQEVALL